LRLIWIAHSDHGIALAVCTGGRKSMPSTRKRCGVVRGKKILRGRSGNKEIKEQECGK